jgi:hypothetical protein
MPLCKPLALALLCLCAVGAHDDVCTAEAACSASGSDGVSDSGACGAACTGGEAQGADDEAAPVPSDVPALACPRLSDLPGGRAAVSLGTLDPLTACDKALLEEVLAHDLAERGVQDMGEGT